jgi:hypothetical protein
MTDKETMSDEEANDIRLIANEIINRLYKADKREQLWILMSYAKVAIEYIDNKKENTP